MRNLRYILTLLLGTLALGAWSQDFARMSEQSISGTARYVGMSGAMTAIGGDPSAAMDNVAGLGLYRRSELLLTFEELIDKTWQTGYTGHDLRHSFMCPHASVVFSLPTFKTTEKGVLFNNIMFSYHRKNCFNRTLYGRGEADNSLGSIIPKFFEGEPVMDILYCDSLKNVSNSLDLWEWGASNMFSFDWAMNISNRWFVGAGLRLLSASMEGRATYKETFDFTNEQSVFYSNENATTIRYSTFSCAFAAGLIYRPTGWLRLGVGIQTPSLGGLSIYTTGTLNAKTDSLRTSYAPNLSNRDNSFHMPMHLSSSVAFQIGAYGMIGLQYDYFYQPSADSYHSLRTGIEVIPVLGLYINAGYAFESKFNSSDRVVPIDPTFDRQDTYFVHPRWSQNASFAIGYRGESVMFQVAYQYRWQRINLFAHEAANPYDMRADTHRIVLTLGWHGY